MIWFKEAVVPTEIILEIIINTLTLEFHILSFGENSVIFFVLGYLFQLEFFGFFLICQIYRKVTRIDNLG